MFREYKRDKEGIFLPPIEIKSHPQKGYIALAVEDIQAGQLIERCPTVKFSSEMMKDLFDLNDGRSILSDYMFCYTRKGFSYWAMGYGGIYSHSFDPNARWTITHMSDGRDTIDIRAIKDISKGEEITHNYLPKVNRLPGNPRDYLWFDPVEE